ncbi:DUF6615 family protein [Arenibacter sp. S6351L]|uniref:DUF6615 family protein n=1 Tax=Arenibacter sp. S6351L TaxID=2926407 RepID=UPI001FF6350D|nr:DUF6615 family protein [Arenibacter sp. S6351L]MCK0133071.1 hypothetical protein [Arenibacter sp. S6351L]
MTKPCEVFSECTAYVKNWISKQPEVGEESITDWFLFNISEKLPHIKYRQFTRYVEGRVTGADWEWWFVFSNSQSFATRVQAKKIRLNKDNYSGLAHTTQGTLQVDKLIKNARTKGMAAFYAFYTNSDSQTLCNRNGKGYGVYWSEANKVRTDFIQKGRKKVSDSDVLSISNPIECLFCCPLTFKGQNGVEGFKNYLESYFPTYNEQDVNSNIRSENLGFLKTPNHISTLLESKEIPDWYESEFRNRIEGIKSILVIDMRKEK